MEAAIELQKVSRAFGRTWALREASASIPSGKIVGLLGHNGAGKTTLMRLLTGALEVSSGRLSVLGLDPQRQRYEIARRVGYLAEDSPLWPELSVQETLLCIGRHRGLDRQKLYASVGEVSEKLRLEGYLNRPVGALSRGLRQRVGLAQALLHKPDILILDEPTTGLDPNQLMSFRALIRDYGREHTVLLSTHLLQEVEALCDEALVLNQGRLSEAIPLRDPEAQAFVIVLRGLSSGSYTSLTERFGAKEIRGESESRQDGLSEIRRIRVDAAKTDENELLKWLADQSVELLRFEKRDSVLADIFADLSGRPTEADSWRWPVRAAEEGETP